MISSVLYNNEILPSYYLLGLNCRDMTTPKPGQFYMLRVSKGIEPLLRRPFGAYKTIRLSTGDIEGIEILYRVVGKGTLIMSVMRPGDKVDLLGPFGRGFSTCIGQERLIMVAGGVGIVPFYLLSEELMAMNKAPLLLLGGKSKKDLPGVKDFEQIGVQIKIATENGEVGKKGLVTELLTQELTTDSIVYACGPKGMLKEVVMITAREETPCYVSLDKVMACGIGACLGCVVKGRNQYLSGIVHQSRTLYKMVCKDGPTFDAKEIAWEDL